MAVVMVASEWRDYELLEAGDGQKLERWGGFILRRPEPQAVWPMTGAWQDAHAVYNRSNSGGGSWDFYKKIPDKWTISYKNLKFFIEPMGFKHTGIFPEQAFNWDFAMDRIRANGSGTSVLNLFAYTGGATAACASAGASVCHVDAAKGMVARAKANLELSGLGDKPVRYIVDDVVKFVKKEIRRGRKYDCIIMDPPAYGRGPSGELWKIEDTLYELADLCSQLLTDRPLFFLINAYASSLSPLLIENIMGMILLPKFGGRIDTYELGLDIKARKMVLPCGFTGRWECG
ncbi:MAG: class I SAM-dependent methyltransferase [Clostridia bacterium]|nr:class I SAM-dependent methyltransferase [Clostridia bacterium]